METIDTIRQLLAAGESAHLEFLPSDADFGDVARSICALLNSGGGQIVVGVSPLGRPDGDVEAAQMDNMLRPLASGGNSTGHITPTPVWDISDEYVDGHRVVLIDVPAGLDRPYIFDDNIWVRADNRVRPATGLEMREMVDARFLAGQRWERQVALGVDLKDLDEREILDTAKAAMSGRGWTFPNMADPASVLTSLNLLDEGRPTNAAVVLFAKNAGYILPQTRIRATAYVSDKTGAAIQDDQVLMGSAFDNIKAFESFIARHVSLRSDFSSGSAARRDRPALPYWAVREGFRNAVMHRDYAARHGQVSVGLHPDRLDIWSYGRLPKDMKIESIKKFDRSIPVNPDIAQALFLRGLVELLGRGTRKIVEEFKSDGLAEPTWSEEAGGIKLSMRTASTVKELPRELNQRQVDFLVRTRPGMAITVTEYMQRPDLRISERTARGDLAQLVAHAYVSRQGRGRSTFYVRTEKPIA